VKKIEQEKKGKNGTTYGKTEDNNTATILLLEIKEPTEAVSLKNRRVS